jgi:SAM-dependent methyltransferase
VTTNYFDEPIAARYDAELGEWGEPATIAPVVDVLADLAKPAGAALEFGIGTGRIALPLAARGTRVQGIELSEAMLAKLREKPGAEAIVTVQGDFSQTRIDATFDVVYLVFNTINNVTTQDGQVAVFENAAAHLRPGGHFVIEVGIPQLRRLAAGEAFVAFDVSGEHLGFDEYDVVNQGLVSHHYTKVDGEFVYDAAPFRYVWPAELDLMARIAGMRLVQRWAGWKREPFTSESSQHVSIWQKPA